MWYLIVSIPDLCTLTYFYTVYAETHQEMKDLTISIATLNALLKHPIKLYQPLCFVVLYQMAVMTSLDCSLMECESGLFNMPNAKRVKIIS